MVGLPAAHFIVVFPEVAGHRGVGMQVTALEEDDVYTITIVTETNFDKYLPVFEYMMSTIEFTDKLNTG